MDEVKKCTDDNDCLEYLKLDNKLYKKDRYRSKYVNKSENEAIQCRSLQHKGRQKFYHNGYKYIEVVPQKENEKFIDKNLFIGNNELLKNYNDIIINNLTS